MIGGLFYFKKLELKMLKMVFSLSVLVSLNLFAANANQNSYSQQLKILDDASSTISLIPSYSSSSYSSKGQFTGRTISREMSGQDNTIKFEKGINSVSSFSVQTLIGNTTLTQTINGTKREYKFSGLGDVTFTYKALQAKELSSVIWGGDFNLSLKSNELASTSDSGNYASGGHSIRPFVGYEFKNGTFVTGGLISYQLFGDRESVFKDKNPANNFSETTTGGNILEAIAFTEMHKTNYNFGVLAGVESENAHTIEKNNVLDTMDPRTFIKGNIYGNIVLNNDLSFSPTLKYRTLTSKNIDGYKISKQDEMELFLGLNLNL